MASPQAHHLLPLLLPAATSTSSPSRLHLTSNPPPTAAATAAATSATPATTPAAGTAPSIMRFLPLTAPPPHGASSHFLGFLLLRPPLLLLLGPGRRQEQGPGQEETN